MLKLVLSIGFLFSCSVLWAQSSSLRGLQRIDSLESVARQLSGEAKVDLLNSMALECASYDERRSNGFTLEALELSEKIGYSKGQALSLIYRALYEQSLGDQEKAGQFYFRGVNLARKAGIKNVEGYGLVKFANFLTIRGQTDSAMLLFNRAYEVLNSTDYQFELSILYKEWSKFYGVQGQREKQLELLNKSYALRKTINRPNLLADIYLQLADYHMEMQEYDRVEYFLQQANYINTLQVHSPDIKNSYKFRSAILQLRQSEYQEALTLLNEVKEYYQSNGLWYEYVATQYEIGYIFSEVGNYELSLSNAYDGLKIAETKGYTYEQAKLLWQLGWVYPYLKQYTLAREFASRSLSLSKKNYYRVLEGTNYNLLGVIFYDTKDYDSSFYYLKQALTIREIINDPLRIASTLNNLGYLMHAQGKYREAIAYQVQSLELETKSNNSIGIAWCNLALGKTYNMMKDFERAAIHLRLAEEMARKAHGVQALHDIYLEMADVAEKTKNTDRSLIYYKRHLQLKDSLYNSSLSNRMASLQVEYSLLQKNQQIELLNKDKELKDAELVVRDSRLRQQQLIILFGSVIFFMLLVASYLVYRNYVKVRSLNFAIQEKTEEIQAQSEELQLSNQTIARINEELESTVEERTRELKQAYKELDTFFYRSSHDFRRPLTTFMGLAEVAKVAVTDPYAITLFEKVNQTARSLDKMLLKLQSISDVGSSELIYKELYVDEVLTAVMNVFSEEIKERNIKVITELNILTPFLSYPALIKVIVENLIENSIVFSSNQSTIRICINSNEDGLTICVEDTGWGIEEKYLNQVFDMYFRAHERSKGNGLGLYIVKKIVQKLRGNIELTSIVNEGTQVSVFLPHQTKAVTAT
ncbi:MAG: tetratricopeptide repeat protein [Cyclobacteriaceae bacterium]|nr:tetratricopeptide repeat protein [Cyclobacteriaceae bacterium]UYN85995.1 MAG: tetratricopeptide repeat protein [Cyclobacteriaceae bacterium]